jgi:hypothetical protein
MNNRSTALKSLIFSLSILSVALPTETLDSSSNRMDSAPYAGPRFASASADQLPCVGAGLISVAADSAFMGSEDEYGLYPFLDNSWASL